MKTWGDLTDEQRLKVIHSLKREQCKGHGMEMAIDALHPEAPNTLIWWDNKDADRIRWFYWDAKMNGRDVEAWTVALALLRIDPEPSRRPIIRVGVCETEVSPGTDYPVEGAITISDARIDGQPLTREVARVGNHVGLAPIGDEPIPIGWPSRVVQITQAPWRFREDRLWINIIGEQERWASLWEGSGLPTTFDGAWTYGDQDGSDHDTCPVDLAKRLLENAGIPWGGGPGWAQKLQSQMPKWGWRRDGETLRTSAGDLGLAITKQGIGTTSYQVDRLGQTFARTRTLGNMITFLRTGAPQWVEYAMKLHPGRWTYYPEDGRITGEDGAIYNYEDVGFVVIEPWTGNLTKTGRHIKDALHEVYR